MVLQPLPEWWTALKPEAEFRTRYLERMEEQDDDAGLELGVRGAIYPKLYQDTEFGLEISAANTNLGSRADAVKMSEGMSNKSIGISQAYLAYAPQWNTLGLPTLVAGKFFMPFQLSPITWDEDLRPEGFYEALSFSNAKKTMIFKLHAGQFAADRVQESLTSGTPLRRSWLFLQGLELKSQVTARTRLSIASQFFYFYDISERLSEASARLGNTPQSPTNLRRLDTYFAPVELNAKVESKQFGIIMAVELAAAFNVRSSDKQRSFHAKASAGQEWKARHIYGSIGYQYVEPDSQLAYFVDDEWAHSNRKAARFQLFYYALDHLRIGGSYLLASTVSNTNFQANRNEFYFELKLQI